MRTDASSNLFNVYKNADRLARLMAQRADNELPNGMTMARFELLDFLANIDEPVSPSHIAAALHLTPAAVTHLVGHLERENLLEVVPNQNDRRSRMILLTQAGRAMHRSCMLALSGLTSRLLARFSPEMIRPANDLLEEMSYWLANTGRHD